MNRTREFFEELGQAGDYPTAILELEFDECLAGQADDRLFMLSRLETKSMPKRVARIQMLRTFNQAQPDEIDTIDLIREVPADQTAAYDYDIVALDLIPEQNLLLAVRNLIGFDVNDIEISPDGQFALVACQNGLFVVSLGGVTPFPGGPGSNPTAWERDQSWALMSTHYTLPTSTNPNPFPLANSQTFGGVEGVAWIGTTGVVLSLGGPNDAGAVALYGFGHHSKSLTLLRDPKEDRKPAGQDPGVDQIAGVDCKTGGTIETVDLGAGVHRVYATSNGSGAVVEFAVLPVAEPSLNQVGYFASTTHFTETPDCRPYIWPPFGLVPVVLVPRYQQTLLMLRAAPASGG